LRTYFEHRVQPALRALLESAAGAGEIRTDVHADDLLRAVSSLCMSAHNDGPDHAQRMVALLIDGLRYGAAMNV
jgi:transcriptional regulator SbtR-like protein